MFSRCSGLTDVVYGECVAACAPGRLCATVALHRSIISVRQSTLEFKSAYSWRQASKDSIQGGLQAILPTVVSSSLQVTLAQDPRKRARFQDALTGRCSTSCYAVATSTRGLSARSVVWYGLAWARERESRGIVFQGSVHPV